MSMRGGRMRVDKMADTIISPPPSDPFSSQSITDRRDFIRAAAALGLGFMAGPVFPKSSGSVGPDLIIRNAKITTLDPKTPTATAIAFRDGVVLAVGSNSKISKLASSSTKIVDAQGRRIIPGLTDSHTHVIRGGLRYNLELRWDGVRSLATAMQMLREQVARTPAPQWVRVVGGWSEYQFEEQRSPTLKELNEIAPDTPVLVLNRYALVLMNRAALRAAGYTKDSATPPGALLEKDRNGEPTGLLLAEANPFLLYAALAQGPMLGPDDQTNSMLHFMRELNRLGVTSVGDAAGGGQNYPDDYAIIQKLADEGRLTLRFAYNLLPQRAKHELEDMRRWVANGAKPGQGSDYYRLLGAGEVLVFSAADFEDFLMPRPEQSAVMESELEDVVRFLAGNGWPWRMHATYNETVSRALNIFERVHRDIPIDKLGWFFDHCEFATPENLERIKKLGGGIAIQNRMSTQGEYFIRRYGLKAAAETPPVKRMLSLDLPVSLGTDATRVNSYNPWQALYWLVSGRTIGGTVLYPEEQRLERLEALRLMTADGAWFSHETGKKGVLKPGAFGDAVVLDKDYFTVGEDDIQDITSVLTVLGGKVVHAAGSFESLAPALPPVAPSWSPVAAYGGYQSRSKAASQASASERRFHYAAACSCSSACLVHGHDHAFAANATVPASDATMFWGALGCSCHI
jgi:predicted amidohydrolase YtcJ